MTLRFRVWVGLLTIVVCYAGVVGAGFAVLQSLTLLPREPSAVRERVATPLGAISFASTGDTSSFRIAKPGAKALMIAASHLSATNALGVILRGEIDNLVLEDLKGAFTIGTEAAGTTGPAILEQLPDVRLLEIRNAEILVSFAGSSRRVRFSAMNAKVEDYSAQTGGTITFHAAFDAASGGEPAIAAIGSIGGKFQFRGPLATASGAGTVECAVDSAHYWVGGRTVSLGRATLKSEFAYDRTTERLVITSLRGDSEDLGAIHGAAQIAMGPDVAWSATLSATAIDVARVAAVLRPLLPEEYRTWTVQGQGAVEVQAQGTMSDEQPSLDGEVTLSVMQGGFSSPDSTKAAQGVVGRFGAHATYIPPERKLAFNVRAEQRDGEYLWGTYYNNLAGRRASLMTDGHVFFGDGRRFDLKGVLDLFQTGEYVFNASGKGDTWTGHVKAGGVSHARIIDTLLREYLKGLSASLASIQVTGTSSLEARVHREADAVGITGRYRMEAASLNAPDVPVSIQGIAADVPFTLRYPPAPKATATLPPPGFIRFESIQRGRLTVESLRVPVSISENTLEVPEPIIVPFFGGRVRLYGLQVDDVLYPTRYRFGVKIADVDLGRLTNRLAGVEYPGTVNADLGMMRYEKSRIASEGKAVVSVLGGEIEAEDLFAENLASASRKMGGDITFTDLRLAELTQKIAIGRMSGVIRGSLRNLVIEYGEPASFTLEVESVEKRGVAQWISMDAIQSISILGTGADSALNQGITRLFKQYPYSKIGFRCVLKNDNFSVNGTIHEGGKEYLVQRGWFRGVDVVNQNPHNVISFRDMEERIQRIFRTSHIEPGGIKVE